MAITRAAAGCLVGVLVAGAPVMGKAEGHYAIQATFMPERAHTSTNTHTQMNAILTRERAARTNSAYSIAAQIESPLGCSSDTIFTNGFDP
jgi:hypothetical protein